MFLFGISFGFAQRPATFKTDSVYSKKDTLKKTILPKLIAKKDTLQGKKLKSTVKNSKLTLSKAFGAIPYTPNEKPKIVFVRSLILPGWGQISNKDYFKVPFIYAGAAVGGYFIVRNHKKFKYLEDKLTTAYKNNKTEATIEKNNIITGPYSLNTINNAAKQYKRWEQGTVIGVAVGWLLFAVEANVAAHLKSFDVSDDISMKLKPSFSTQNAFATAGLTLEIKF
jgi:Family of unknown function (DUF5683)